MKNNSLFNYLKFIAIFLFTFVLITACNEEEIEIVSDYEFKIVESHISEGIVAEASPIEFEIQQKKNDKADQKFNISYRNVEGGQESGYLIYKDERIEEGAIFTVSSNEKIQLIYFPTVVGDRSGFYLIAENPFQKKDSTLIDLAISHMEFDVLFELEQRIKMGKKYTASVKISNNDEDGSVSYQTAWSTNNEKLKLFKDKLLTNKLSEYNELGVNNYVDSITYLCNSLDTATIFLKIKDSNGLEREFKKKLIVEATDFKINLQSNKKQIFVNTVHDILQSFETEDNSIDYKVTYKILSEGILEKDNFPVDTIEKYDIKVDMRVVSAHKNGEEILKLADEYNNSIEPGCVIAVAGRSNGLGGALAANLSIPVINCPPFSDKDDMMVNVYSSLMMPSKTPATTVAQVDNAAYASMRSLNLQRLKEIFNEEIQNLKQSLIEADKKVRGR